MSAQAARQACSFFLGRLEAEVSRLRTVAFPGRHAGPQKWLNLVGGILETGRNYLETAADPMTTAAVASQLIQDAEALGEYAYEALKHVAGADATQIPEQVIAPFQRWVDRLQIQNEIFFRAEHLSNYELARLDARGLATVPSPSQGLSDAIAAIKWPTLRLTVPGQAMGMLPHFAVVAHELGHAIQDAIKPDLTPHRQALVDCHGRIQGRLTPLSIPFGSKETLRIQEIIGNWTNELKADAVGYCLVGPAFFFALCGFLELTLRSYGIAPTHPPTELRRDLLISKLSLGAPSFKDVLQQKTGLLIDKTVNSPHLPACPASDVLFTELRSKFNEVDAAICVELVPYARQIADTIFTATDAHLQNISANLIYQPANLKFDLCTHLEALCDLIPPIEFPANQTMSAASLASILNVGWAALLTRVDQIPPTTGTFGNEVAHRMERLHDLLLKAVELSEARLLWEEHQ